ncbi:MAG: thermonuclease family protein [Bacilli bacterium]|nr:thermonuclease family protein [Bacilli bacterium]
MKKTKRIIYSILTLFLAFFMVSCKDEYDFSTKYTDELRLETEYENKSFMADGIESVTLVQAVDGDTAHFQDGSKNTIKIRFLAINTPESTGQIAPWGNEASAFAKSKLENAVEIVIESEVVGQAPVLDSTGSRYLAYVWYRTSKNAEFRNLNLETIEASFSFFIGLEDNLKYGETFKKAYLEVYPERKRVFGEPDPNFDYSGKTIDTTIAEIRYFLSSYSTGTNLRITARVVRLVGNSLYIEDLEETYIEDLGKSVKGGIFLYHSFVSRLGRYQPGDVFEFECQASDSETYGFQLVNARNIRTKEEGTEVNIQDLPDDVTSLKDYEGLVIRINEFTVTSLGNQNEETRAYTIYGNLKNGTKIQVRVDADTSPKLAYSVPEIGKTFTVIGGVSRFVDFFNEGEVIYQIKLGNQKGVGLEDFKLIQ